MTHVLPSLPGSKFSPSTLRVIPCSSDDKFKNCHEFQKQLAEEVNKKTPFQVFKDYLEILRKKVASNPDEYFTVVLEDMCLSDITSSTDGGVTNGNYEILQYLLREDLNHIMVVATTQKLPELTRTRKTRILELKEYSKQDAIDIFRDHSHLELEQGMVEKVLESITTLPISIWVFLNDQKQNVVSMCMQNQLSASTKPLFLC